MAHPSRLRNRRIGVETGSMRNGGQMSRDRRALAALVAMFALMVQALGPRGPPWPRRRIASEAMLICTGTGCHQCVRAWSALQAQGLRRHALPGLPGRGDGGHPASGPRRPAGALRGRPRRKGAGRAPRPARGPAPRRGRPARDLRPPEPDPSRAAPARGADTRLPFRIQMTLQIRALRGALLAGAALCAQPRLRRPMTRPPPSPASSCSPRRRAPTGRCRPRPSTPTGSPPRSTPSPRRTRSSTCRRSSCAAATIGDTQAPLTTRTSGVGSSARSLIYADGVLLSALIGNNNSTASPRWGMVAPEEIERIEVLYGPFSAAYAGNSIGAVVNITTREPESFEAQAKVSAGAQHFRQYATADDLSGLRRPPRRRETGADRSGGGSAAPIWRPAASRSGYVTATPARERQHGGIPVSGAFADVNRTGAPIVVLGAGRARKTEPGQRQAEAGVGRSRRR